MGLIINIDEAIRLRSEYNILNESLTAMLKDKQEQWEKKNPIDLLFVRASIDGFQETYTSNIGFDHAFQETSDYAVAPIYNTEEGFAATYRTRTFQGGFKITQQVIEDKRYGKARDDASSFIKRWHGDIVEYCMTAMSAGFGNAVEWGDSQGHTSTLKLNSADTVDGTLDGAKNPLFSKAHTIVKRKGMTDAEVTAAHQSNLFYIPVDLAGDDMAKMTKLADGINQVITIMENYKDDNNKFIAMDGTFDIVTANDALLKSSLNTVLSMPMYNDFGQMLGKNPAYQRANYDYTSYLNAIPQCKEGRGFFIVNKGYNAENHGLELTERVPLTMNVEVTKNPYGISYDGRQRFDVNNASWRGIAYVYIGTPAGASGDWDDVTKYTKITPSATVVKEVRVVNTTAAPVNTKTVS